MMSTGLLSPPVLWGQLPGALVTSGLQGLCTVHLCRLVISRVFISVEGH